MIRRFLAGLRPRRILTPGRPPLDRAHDYETDLLGRPFRGSDARHGVLLMAAPRSGKSSIMEWLLRQAVIHKKRLICIDFDGELAWRLKAVAPDGYLVKRLDYFTQPGHAVLDRAWWRTEVDRAAWASQVAPIADGSQNTFFDAWAQKSVFKAASILNRTAPDSATLGDLVRLVEYPELMTVLGEKYPEIGDPFAALGHRGRSARDVFATVEARIQQTRILAALSERAEFHWDPDSLFDGPPHAVVLVFKDRFKHALAPLLTAALDNLIYRKNSMPGPEQLHVGLDEVASLNRLESLVDICRRGSKATICYYLSAHSPEGIYKKYGKEDGEDILNLPAHKIFLKQSSKSSATFASDAIGVVEIIERMAPEIYHHGKDFETQQTLMQKTVKERALVLPDELRRSIPLADWDENSLTGYVVGVNGRKRTYSREFENAPFQHMVQTPTPPPEREPVPAAWQVLRAWDGERELRDRLNVSQDDINRAKAMRERNRRGGGDREQEQ